MKKQILAVALTSVALFSYAQADTIFSADHSGLGAMVSPGSLTDTFNSSGASSVNGANLDFQLAGYNTLDGYNNCCTDIFTLTVNGTNIFSGSWNLGGGGDNVVLYNPNGGTAIPAPTNAAPGVLTGNGGTVDIHVPFTLLAGVNSITYSYNGAPQGLGDEGWGINAVTVTGAVPEPETYAMMMAGLGLVGAIARRKQKVAA